MNETVQPFITFMMTPSLSQKMDEILHPLGEEGKSIIKKTQYLMRSSSVWNTILTICKEMITNFMKYSNGINFNCSLLEQNNYTIQYKDKGNKTIIQPWEWDYNDERTRRET